MATSGGALISLKPEKGFDFTHNELCDGYLLKHVVFEQKGIKLMQKFRPVGMPGEREYLFLATFTQRQPKPVNNFEMGFTSETKAPDIQY